MVHNFVSVITRHWVSLVVSEGGEQVHVVGFGIEAKRPDQLVGACIALLGSQRRYARCVGHGRHHDASGAGMPSKRRRRGAAR